MIRRLPRTTRLFLLFVFGFFAFLGTMTLAERAGMSSGWIGSAFLLAPIVVYAAIGVFSRTSDVVEYYVAGRRVPAIFNGIATAADWISAASFIGLAGTLYFGGFDGLSFVMGWTGGYVLVALLLAPYLRRFGQFTIPDFLGARYEGHLPRLLAVGIAVLASFVYLVAQIYAVGLITSRFAGVRFELGVFVGLAGVLVCSFLGGMRAITWTQVAQYVVRIVAYLVPLVILSSQLTGSFLPQLSYGTVLERLGRVERDIAQRPDEETIRELHRQQAQALTRQIATLPASLHEARAVAHSRLDSLLIDPNAKPRDIAAAQRVLRELPPTPEAARHQWERQRNEATQLAQPLRPHVAPYHADTPVQSRNARINFLALVIVLMLGTASMPHILARSYTTPSVATARSSVFWTLLFILLLYLAAPACAVFAKWSVYTQLVGTPIAQLPAWVHSWGKVGLVRVGDLNADGILQLSEITLNPDVIVLALPEIAGLPYVVSGLVAAGALAAALSTADGLLLTLSSALSHDVYYRMVNPAASTPRRLVVSKTSLMVVAVVAALIASLRPESIIQTVGFAFSLAAAGFFPALVLGIFWARANKWGAVAGMLGGVVVALMYAVLTHPLFGGSMANAWFGIQPIASGLFGTLVGFVVIPIVSLLTPRPGLPARTLVSQVRFPGPDG